MAYSIEYNSKALPWEELLEVLREADLPSDGGSTLNRSTKTLQLNRNLLAVFEFSYICEVDLYKRKCGIFLLF